MKKLMVATGLAVVMLSGCAVYPVGHGYAHGYSAYPAYPSYTVITPARPYGGAYGGGYGGGYGGRHGGRHGGWGHGGDHHWHH